MQFYPVNCVALIGFEKMTPSEIGSDGPVRDVAGGDDARHARIFHESDQHGDVVSLHGQRHPVKQKQRSHRRGGGYGAGGKISSLREDRTAAHVKNGQGRCFHPHMSDKAKKQAACGVGCCKEQTASGYKGKHILPSWMSKPNRPNGFAGLYAALDLGTNNCRLLIATPTRPGHFRVIDAFSRIVRLGEGMERTRRLSDDAMNRAIEALKVCHSKLIQADITHQWLIATEACRLAENGADFIDRVRCETGLDLEIVDRETEARLAVSGCGTLVERKTEAIVLFDIGGGSSEIALIDISKRRSPRLAEHIIAWTSLPVGVVTLAERFGGEVVTEDDFVRMKNYVRKLLDKFSGRYKLDHLANSPNFHLLGTSGTVTTLAGIYLNLDRYDRRRVDGMWLKSADVTRMTEVLLSWDMSQRMANPCIGVDRADLVLAGCAILEAIRSVWPGSRLRVADRGLREGILTELMSRTGAWRRSYSVSARRGNGGTGKVSGK